MIGTKVNIIDLSEYSENPEIITPDSAPVILTCGPSAKGTEKMVSIKGAEYRTMFGDPDFKKYGQASVQNQRMIDAGARLVHKRIVATDAELANTTIIADIEFTTTEALDENGEKIPQLDEEGNPIVEEVVIKEAVTVGEGEVDFETGETISSGTTVIEPAVVEKRPVYVMENNAVITYDAISMSGYKTIEDIAKNYEGEVGIIPDDVELAEGEVIYDPRLNQYQENPAEADYIQYLGYWIVKEADLVEKTVPDPDGEEEDSTKKVKVLKDGVEPIKRKYRYALWTVSDVGRGVSTKSFLVTPENALSKKLPFMYYTFAIIDNNSTIESVRCSILPDVLYRGECVDLNMSSKNSLQYSNITCYEDNVFAFINTISEISGVEIEDLQSSDFIFGTTRKGIQWKGIIVNGFSANAKEDAEGINFSQVNVPLDAGSNGSFGLSPMNNPSTRALVEEKIFMFLADDQSNYEYDDHGKIIKYVSDEDAKPKKKKGYFYLDAVDDIFDLDNYQIDAFFDFNLPIKSKGAVAVLANYRGDFHYFRDHGFDVGTLDDIAAIVSGDYYNTFDEITKTGEDNSDQMVKSFFISDWVQSYEVINPYDMKQIKVTIMYDLSHDMINHILTNVNKPYAGERNNAIITSIIKDTLNYKPRITPFVNEKDELEDLKVNFASYYKDKFIIETLFTSQEKNSQLSYINNIMAVQRVIKALRVKFPSIRYQYITSSEDLDAYTSEINEFLSIYSGMFNELRFEYVPDKTMQIQKVYRAALYFRFNEFTMGEYIDAYMLPTEGIY